MRSVLTMMSGTMLTVLTSCALTNKADPLNVRYFDPHIPGTLTSTQGSGAGQAPVTVHIERVDGAAHLTEAIAYRKSETELAYFEGLRWTEQPSVYLERAIGEALFSDTTRTRGLSDTGYALDVSLEAFEQLRYGEPRVRIVARAWVADERVVVSERRFIVERPIAEPAPDPHAALAKAFNGALNEVARLIRVQVDQVAAARSSTTMPTQPLAGVDGDVNPTTESPQAASETD